MQEKPKYIIGVIGVRDFREQVYDNKAYVQDRLLGHIRRVDTDLTVGILTGGSKGVESLAAQVADDAGIPFKKIPPNIQQYGNVRAFIVRNTSIVSSCDELVVFWDGVTKQPIDAIATAMLVGRVVTVYPLI